MVLAGSRIVSKAWYLTPHFLYLFSCPPPPCFVFTGLVVAHTPAVSVELRQDKDTDNGAGARASEAATCKDKQPNNQQELQLEELFKVRC